MNTVGYLTISKKMPMYKRTPIKKVSKNNYSINNYTTNDINNVSKNNYKLLSRVFSKNKFRGVLDTTSPNNKDIFIDSDSERPAAKISKNVEKENNNANRSGCAKLVIEKIESQEPTYNNEYYKFTNQKPKFNRINTNILYKKNINNKSFNKENSKNQRENSSNNYLIQQKNKNNQVYSYYQKVNNGTIKRNNKHISTNNIFEKNSNLYNSNNNYYEPDYFFKTQIGFSKTGKKMDVSPISKSPYYVKTSNDTFQKDSSAGKNFIIYTNDSNGFSTNNQEFPNPNNLNTKFHYIYNNNTEIKNRKCKIDEPKKHSLYENYKDLIKMSTFKKLSKNNCRSEKIIKFYPINKDKIIKIQSRWRGAYVRELMAFYWNLNKFKNIIYKVMKYHIHYYFICFKDSLANSNKNFVKKNLNCKIFVNKRYNNLNDKENDNNKEKESKLVEEYKQTLKQKEEDYENLLKNYNSLVERCTELQQIINENNNKNDKNVIWKELNLDSKNITNKMDLKDVNQKDKDKDNKNISKIKAFDAIKPEQKETFNIIDEKDTCKGLKLKANNNNKNSCMLIERQKELLIENNLNLVYQDYLNHFISNLKSINNQQFLIEKTKNNKTPYNIINFQLSLINNKIKKPQLIGIYHLEPLNLISNSKEKAAKAPLNEVCHNEPFSLINNKIKPKLFDIISINKGDNSEITILNNSEKEKDKNKARKKNELISEKQINLKLEIKGLEHPKVKIFKDCIINKHINNINIIQIKKQNKFDQKLISVDNVISIDISKEIGNEKEKEKEGLNKEKINRVINEQFMIEKITKNEDKNKIKSYQERNIIICENERFCLIKISEDNNKKNKDKEKKVELVIEKKDNILLTEIKTNKNTKLDIEFIIVNNDNLFIQKIKKKQCDKITEITEELNKIEPNNHYELIFEGLINLNEDFSKKDNNLINSNKNENIIDNNKQEFSFIKKESNDKKQEINNINVPNKNTNYNLTNEIEKENGLEINPLEIKKTKNNANNIFISYENKLEVLYNPNAIFTEKAKRNMMKIILPIRLKTTLRDFIYRSIFPLLINNLKKIALASQSKKGDGNNIIESKKEKDDSDKIIEDKKEKVDEDKVIENKKEKEKDDEDKKIENIENKKEKEKEKGDEENKVKPKEEKSDSSNSIGDNIIELRREEAEKRRGLKSSFYKSYSKQMKKKEIKNIFVEYAVYKWNKLLHGLAKEINSNKGLVLEKIKK